MTWLWRTAVLRGWGRVEVGCWAWFRLRRYVREQGRLLGSAWVWFWRTVRCG